ncbi:MAG: methyl-accepting chemotaxis protein [Treponema sp.]|jgi:methyl-accepting chemotaxis protein|nr:methyl-accepting chemotaxis protein [Treponema sp.]
MKLNIRLTVINASVTIALIAVISVVILWRASILQREAAEENMINLASSTAKDIRTRYQTYTDVARTLAHIMNSYESVNPELRRSRYNETMYGVLESNPSFMGIYTVWRPDALDGRDAEFARTPGTDESGQFISHYVRNAGQIVLRPYAGYKEALVNLSTDDTVSNPVPTVVNGSMTFVFSIRVPIETGTGVVGLVGVEIDIAPLQSIVEAIRPYKMGYAAVYANDGTVAAHPDGKRGTYFYETGIAELGQEGIDSVLKSIGTGEITLSETEDVLLVSYPFTLGNAKTPWTVMILAPVEDVLAQIRLLINFVIVFVIGAGIVAAIVIFFTSNKVAKRIIRIANTMKDISEGEGDLTRRLNIIAKDEIGNMVRYFNDTLDKIRNLVINIKTQSQDLADTGEELSENMIKTTEVIAAISSHIQHITGQTTSQSASVSQTNNTMRQITAAIEELNTHVETQSLNISQSSAAIEEMLANIASVTKTLVKNTENMDNLTQASDMGRNGLTEVSIDIQSIAKESEGLLEITAVMEGIASQTNLLSMNAAIEAAHAGESGKGFAVVADEIRKLAESSSEQSKTIASVLQKIKESIDKISMSTNAVLNRFEAIDQHVRIVSEQEEQVRSAMEEQGVGSKNILDNLSKLNDITCIIKEDSAEMLDGSQAIMQASKNLEAVTEVITNGMQEMAAGAKEINHAVNRVSAISDENKQHIDTLVSEISKFKIE